MNAAAMNSRRAGACTLKMVDPRCTTKPPNRNTKSVRTRHATAIASAARTHSGGVESDSVIRLAFYRSASAFSSIRTRWIITRQNVTTAIGPVRSACIAIAVPASSSATAM